MRVRASVVVAAVVVVGAVVGVEIGLGETLKECRSQMVVLEDVLRQERVKFLRQQRVEHLVMEKAGLLKDVQQRLDEASVDGLHGEELDATQRLFKDFLDGIDSAYSSEQTVENVLDSEISMVLASDDKKYHGIVKWISHVAMIVPLMTAGYLVGRVLNVSPQVLHLLLYANQVGLSAGCFAFFLLFEHDPLRFLKEVHPHVALLLQFLIGITLPMLIGLIWLNVFLSRDVVTRSLYAAQVFPVAFMALDYRWRIWLPVIYDIEIYAPVLFAYLAYGLLSCGLLIVTLYAQNPSHSLFRRSRELLVPTDSAFESSGADGQAAQHEDTNKRL